MKKNVLNKNECSYCLKSDALVIHRTEKLALCLMDSGSRCFRIINYFLKKKRKNKSKKKNPESRRRKMMIKEKIRRENWPCVLEAGLRCLMDCGS